MFRLSAAGLDVGYFITPSLQASVGYYYQHRDQEEVDGSGVRGRLAYEISNGLIAGVNVSYDEAFDTRVSADLSCRFGGSSKEMTQELPVISALTSTPSNRDVRVHDCGDPAEDQPLWEWFMDGPCVLIPLKTIGMMAISGGDGDIYCHMNQFDC